MAWQSFVTNHTPYNFCIEGSKEAFDQYNLSCADEKNEKHPKASHAQCRNCGCRQIFIDVKQTRSGDEGATTVYSCTSCKRMWTQN